MNNEFKPITDSDQPIIDFGESWGRIASNGERLFEVSKKKEPNWLKSFVQKWMRSDENLTEYGEQYYKEFFKPN